MKNEVSGVVCAIVVAMIHKGLFDRIESKEELRSEIVKTIAAVAKTVE